MVHLFSGLSNFEPLQLKVKGERPELEVTDSSSRADLWRQQQRDSEIVERYRAGETVKALAAELGLHHRTVRAVLVKADAPVRARQRLAQRDIDEIVQLYAAGFTTTEIGDRFGVYASTIGRQLKKLGIELRAPGWRAADERG